MIGDIHEAELKQLRSKLWKFQMYMHRKDAKQETFDRLYNELKDACREFAGPGTMTVVHKFQAGDETLELPLQYEYIDPYGDTP